MEIYICPCGKIARYVLKTNDDGTEVRACNRWIKCPTYTQLKNQLEETLYKNIRLERELDILKRKDFIRKMKETLK